MKFSYRFSNLLGTVYRKGDLVFTPDGNSVITPVSNRISKFDLKNNKSSTLPVESRFNYEAIDLSPNGAVLIAVNEKGDAHLISTVSQTVIYKHRFKQKVPSVKFSPDGKYFAACKGTSIFVFRVPGQFGKEFNPFILERVFHGFYEDVVCIDWTSDSRILIAGSKDSTAKIFALPMLNEFRICSLSSHASSVVAVFFEENSLDSITISSNGRLCIWEASHELKDLKKFERSQGGSTDNANEIDTRKGEQNEKESQIEDKEEGSVDEKLRYKQVSKHYLCNFHQEDGKVHLSSAAYHKKTRILVTGFSNGVFFIHELPDVNQIHSLSIADSSITKISINGTGDWIALGCETHGQLLVWEWQSETYIMKQQGHSTVVSSLAYSNDGLHIVTGGEDGKVKLWNTDTGFCFVTFTEHTSGVSAVTFASNRKFVVSASYDGTVRTFDMTRYRNFRTLTSPRPAQFASVAIDSSCEFIAAGGQDVFEIYLWSVKIGRLLEILSGHEGPVVSLDFNPNMTSSQLVSVSWDKTLRVWDAIEKNTAYEAVRLLSEGVCVCFHPDGEEVIVATLDGQLITFKVNTLEQTGSIEGRNDLGSGRLSTDFITSKKSLQGKSFRSISYSASGNYVLAGGNSKNICIYSARDGILLKKFEVTQNRSFDSVDDFINRRKMTEFGNRDLIEHREDGFAAVSLPGVRKGDMVSRKFKPEIRVVSLQFSPTGQQWAAATTEGILIYSLDSGELFDPFQLEEGITPNTVEKAKKEGRYTEALMMSIRLNEHRLVREVLESTPPSNIELCASSLSEMYVQKLMVILTKILETTKHVEFYLLWVKSLISNHTCRTQPTLVGLEKVLKKKYLELSKLCDYNKYSMQYLIKLGSKLVECNPEGSEDMDVD